MTRIRLQIRLRRLEVRSGPPPAPATPAVELTEEEIAQRVQWWLGRETYNRGIFDDDPAFRPAWSRYHELWQRHAHSFSPLHAVWLPQQPAEFEAARRAATACITVAMADGTGGPWVKG